MVTKVYEYGLLQPTANVEIVREQLRLAHRYYNALIAIERERRAREHQVQLSVADIAAIEEEIETIETEIESTRGRIKGARKAKRGAASTPEANRRARDLKSRRKELRKTLGEAKRAIRENPEIAAKLAEINADAHAAVIDARAKCNVFWGSYLQIEQAVDAAKKPPKPNPDSSKPPKPPPPWHMRPHFHRWDGDGVLAVQLQGGLPVADLFGGDTRVQIAPVPEEAWTHPSRGARKRLGRTTLKLRVGSAGRAPIWAEWPLLMHRQLPEGATITWAKVIARKREPWTRWFLQLTVNEPARVDRAVPDEERAEIVGIDLGWRKTDHGLRVAYFAGSDGALDELVLPTSIPERIEKAEAIQSTRDQHLDVMRAEVVRAIGALPISDAIRERVKSIAAWRSPMRFVALLDAWRKDRCEGDDAIITTLEAWRKRDLHLWQYESGMRRTAIAHRREVYRNFAAEMARRYRTAALERFDLRSVARHPAPEDGPQTKTEAAHQRTIAAVSTLRTALEQAFAARGGDVVRIPAEYSTQCCNACGDATPWDAAKAIEHTCVACGRTWDQDANAARNLCASGPAVKKQEEALAATLLPPKPKLPRWHKRHKASTVTVET